MPQRSSTKASLVTNTANTKKNARNSGQSSPPHSEQRRHRSVYSIPDSTTTVGEEWAPPSRPKGRLHPSMPRAQSARQKTRSWLNKLPPPPPPPPRRQTTDHYQELSDEQETPSLSHQQKPETVSAAETSSERDDTTSLFELRWDRQLRIKLWRIHDESTHTRRENAPKSVTHLPRVSRQSSFSLRKIRLSKKSGDCSPGREERLMNYRRPKRFGKSRFSPSGWIRKWLLGIPSPPPRLISPFRQRRQRARSPIFHFKNPYHIPVSLEGIETLPTECSFWKVPLYLAHGIPSPERVESLERSDEEDKSKQSDSHVTTS